MNIKFFTTVFPVLSLLTACSVPILQKDGAQALYAANNTKDTDLARAHYVDATSSGRRDLRAEAYYEIARIDRDNGDIESYLSNIEQAVALDPENYELRLAQAYYKYGDEAQIQSAKNIFMRYQDVDANANLALAELTGEAHYIETARNLLQFNIEQDFDGKDALKLARTYHQYDAISPDFQKAEYFYRQSIARGNADAAYELAVMWADHNLRDNANEDALTLIMKAAKLDQQKSIKYVAKQYAENNDTANATYWYQTLADKYDERVAHDYLAHTYLKNAQPNLDKIPQRSMDAYKNAARMGSDKGHLVLAIWDNTPNNIKGMSDKDVLKQAKLLKEAFGNRQPTLTRELNKFLAKNNIFEPVKSSGKSSSSTKIDTQSFADELQAAQTLMAQTDDRQSVSKAFEIYKSIAEKGNVEGQYQTGIMYARGIGVEQNMTEAKKWLEKASQNGYPLALQTLQSLSVTE